MNKLLFAIGLFTFATFTLHAQEIVNKTKQPTEIVTGPKKFYLGIGTGINSNTGGMGAAFELRPFPKSNLSVMAGIGIGFWGMKNSIGLRYYNRIFPAKIFYGLAFTTAGAFNQITLDQETAVEGKTEKVTVNMFRSNNIAVTIGYQIKLSKSARLGVELGYSVPLQEITYEASPDSPDLNEKTESLMQTISPGGFVLGIGFTFGIK